MNIGRPLLAHDALWIVGKSLLLPGQARTMRASKRGFVVTKCRVHEAQMCALAIPGAAGFRLKVPGEEGTAPKCPSACETTSAATADGSDKMS